MRRHALFVGFLLVGVTNLSHAQAGTSLLQARSSRCLDVTDGRFDNGTRPQLWDCYGHSDNQQWFFDGAQLKTSHNKCLDVVDGKLFDGAPVQLWDCFAGNSHQAWQQDGGAIKHQGSNFCLDVKDGKFDNGGALQLWTCDGRPNGNQVWAFVQGDADSNSGSNNKGQAPQQSAAQSASTDATTFLGYQAISLDAFIALHPECAPFKDAVTAAAKDQGLNAVFLASIAETESSCQAAPANGWGAFQFSDEGAWQQFGGAGKDRQNIWDAAFAAARFFRYLLDANNNNLDDAMRSYNGPIANGGNPNYQKEVRTWMSGGNPWG